MAGLLKVVFLDERLAGHLPNESAEADIRVGNV
jgi:hypothetical protein